MSKTFMTKEEEKKYQMAKLTMMFIKVYKACCEASKAEVTDLEDIVIIDAIIHSTELHNHPDWYGCKKYDFIKAGVTENEALEEYIEQMAYKWLGIENIWKHPLWTQECSEYIPTLREYLIQNYDYHIEVINALEKEVIEYYNLYNDKMKPDVGEDGYIWGYDIEGQGLRLCDVIWGDCPLFSNSLLESLIEKLHEKKIKLE